MTQFHLWIHNCVQSLVGIIQFTIHEGRHTPLRLLQACKRPALDCGVWHGGFISVFHQRCDLTAFNPVTIAHFHLGEVGHQFTLGERHHHERMKSRRKIG